ncbi:MAG: hypothetical protein AAGF45_02540 [Pseudomonadota bacterium]
MRLRPVAACSPARVRALMLAASLLLCAALPAPLAAFEPTGNLIADAYLRAVENAGFSEARAGSVERVADSTILNDVAGGRDGAARITMDTVILDGALMDADSVIIASAITYDGVAIAGGPNEGSSNLGRVMLTNVRLPTAAPGAESTSALLGTFATLSMGDLTARSAAGETLTLSSLSITRAPAEGTQSAGTIAMEDLVFDLALFEEQAARELRALGYEALSVDLSADAAWDSGNGAATLNSAALSIEEMGTLELKGTATGLTSEVLNRLTSANADFTRLTETLGQVTLRRVEVAFADAGLTGRLLERTSQARQTDRSIIIGQLTDALSRLLATVGDQAFTDTVVSTVRGFLQAPGKVRIRAEPSEPVSALELISAAMLNPRTIPTLLAISIERE